MRAILSLLVCLTVPAFGQSALPPCNPNVAHTSWTNCQGTYTHANGDKYVGEWRDGKRHGQGIYYSLAENQFKGNKYVGEFMHDKFSGQGIETWADGHKYVGEFRDGKRNGQGTHTNANGDKYVGEFMDDKFSGQGIETGADGHKYVGEFRDGKRHGHGIHTFADGRPPSEGVWENNNFVRAQRIPDYIAGRTSTSPLAQAPRQTEPPRSNLTPGDYARYQDAIRSRIRSRILGFDPARAPTNPDVIYIVEQLPTGQISRIQLKKASGMPDWDAAVLRAIKASAPLPKAEDGSVERRLELRFRPLDKR